MILTILFYTYSAIIVTGTLFNLQKAKKLKAMNADNNKMDEVIFETPKLVSQKVLKKIGTTVDVNGQENLPEGAALYIANHKGAFDIPVLLGYLGKPIGFIAKKETKKLPIINKWMELISCVFIDRSDRRQSVKAIQQGTQHLIDGHSMVVFPEGTRSKTGELNTFKSGSLRLATRAKVPIVPLAIEGTNEILEANGGKVKRANVSLTIEKPIYPEEYESKKSGELAAQLQQIIQDRIDKNNGIKSRPPIVTAESVEQ